MTGAEEDEDHFGETVRPLHFIGTRLWCRLAQDYTRYALG